MLSNFPPKLSRILLKWLKIYSFKAACGIQTTNRWLHAELTSELHYIMKSLYYYHHHRHCSTLFFIFFIR
jgi:hypothetical protein